MESCARSGISKDWRREVWIKMLYYPIQLCDTAVWVFASHFASWRPFIGPLWVAGSHKRRDNRCAIAAVKLEEGTSVLFGSRLQHFNSHIPPGLCHALESEGWEVHLDVKEYCALGPPLPETEDAGREEEFLKQVKTLEGADQKKALILKISHIGGHKYAGKLLSCEVGPTLTPRLCRERDREFIRNRRRIRSDSH